MIESTSNSVAVRGERVTLVKDEQSGGGEYSIWAEIVNNLDVPIYGPHSSHGITVPTVQVNIYDANDEVVQVRAATVDTFAVMCAPHQRIPFRYRAQGFHGDLERITRYEIIPLYGTDSNGWEPLTFERTPFEGNSTRDQVNVINNLAYPVDALRLIITTYTQDDLVEFGDMHQAGQIVYPGYRWTTFVDRNPHIQLQAQGRRG